MGGSLTGLWVGGDPLNRKRALVAVMESGWTVLKSWGRP
jgi:hypothetical protein